MAEKNPDELGALWNKVGAKGEYMSGKIGDVSVVVFRNENKRHDRQPDWHILKARPKPVAQQTDAHVAPSDADDSIPF